MSDVIIAVENGCASIVKRRKGVSVELRDYDVPDDWESVAVDEYGNRYQKIIWRSEDDV